MKRGYDLKLFEYVIGELANERPLPQKYRDHALIENYQGFRECHIQPDWLLIYFIEKNILTLTLSRTDSHAIFWNEIYESFYSGKTLVEIPLFWDIKEKCIYVYRSL